MEQTLKFKFVAMLSYIMLLLALIVPVLFRVFGKQWLGNQTHPAALFILAWFASSFLAGGVDFLAASPGSVSLLFVIVGFAGGAFVEKLRQKSKTTIVDNSNEAE